MTCEAPWTSRRPGDRLSEAVNWIGRKASSPNHAVMSVAVRTLAVIADMRSRGADVGLMRSRMWTAVRRICLILRS